MSVTIDGTNGITTPEVDSTGPIAGTTGTFSGAVQASGVATNLYPLVSGTSQTASSTSVDFTGIPSWVKRITVMFSGVSGSGTSIPIIQLGDAGGVETTGYAGTGSFVAVSNTCSSVSQTTGFGLDAASVATTVRSGAVSITNISGNTWVASGALTRTDTAVGLLCAGTKTLSDTLTQIRITTVNGTDTFDAGSINILYE